MPENNLGQCPHCNEPNPYSQLNCQMCGALLPWATAVKAARSVTPSPSAAPPTPSPRTVAHQMPAHPSIPAPAPAPTAPPPQSPPPQPFTAPATTWSGGDAFQDALRSFTALAVNPVGGLAGTFESLDRKRALVVGLVFGAVAALCIATGLFMAVKPYPWIMPAGGRFFKLLLLGLALFASFAASGALARKVFRGTGEIEGDVFTAGASLLPFGLAVLVGSVLGVANIEVIIVIAVLGLCYCVLMLHSGCVTISKTPESGAALSVPLVLLFSAWLVKVIMTTILSN